MPANGETIDMRFGEQLHTRMLAGADDGRELNPARPIGDRGPFTARIGHPREIVSVARRRA